MVNDQDFPKLTGGTRQRGGTGQRRIRYNKINDVSSRRMLSQV